MEAWTISHLYFFVFHVNPLTLHMMKNMHRSKEAWNTSQSITGRQFIYQKRDAALSCFGAGCRLQWRLIHAYWKHPIEMKLPISTLKPATFDGAKSVVSDTSTSLRLCHQLTNDQGCDLCAQCAVFVLSLFSASRFSPSSVLLHFAKHSQGATTSQLTSSFSRSISISPSSICCRSCLATVFSVSTIWRRWRYFCMRVSCSVARFL